MSNNTRIASLELGRIIAIAAIIILHCQLAQTYWKVEGTPWVGYILNQTARFAVPLFFLLAGYFIQPRLSEDPIHTLKTYSRPLIRIWLVWSVISLVMPFNLGTIAKHSYLWERQEYWDYLMKAPLNSLMEGGLAHLWFLPSLIWAVAFLALLTRLGQSRLILPVSFALYVYGVLGGSYQNITELWTPFLTRNGPFFSTFLVSIGFMLRQGDLKVSPNAALWIMLGGMGLHFTEAYWLTDHGAAFDAHDYVFGTALWATGLFLWLLAYPNLGNSPATFYIARSTLGYYVAHPLVIIIMLNIAGIFGLTDLRKDTLVLTGAMLGTFALVKRLERSRLSGLLFR
jgi:surface polysaccharide O-acyltransferase-like enzyme